MSCEYYSDDQFKQKFDSEKGLSIIHFNCRSLYANFSSLETYLNELNLKFDIIAISETWLNLDSNTALYELDGYDMFHVDRSNRRGGGVAVYVKNSLAYKVIDKMCTEINDVLEFVSIEICVKNKKNVIVSCLYRQPGSSTETLTDHIEKMYRNKKSDIYLCGDLMLISLIMAVKLVLEIL
ncbi:hypothetical protein HOLleu_24631 [Holothuria leucospilota]|uniref:Endonuclease/exonuclease/phosphatase domain-containing protein n=1 Tax=Holothuria leucospilota TaxID=206669 RepID=A0A9Q1H3Z2_HOLLE|nr:hypothetical protein HOLleu_24631 [Holothuria leucospilota]